MNAQHLAIGRAIERLHALQTFTRKGSAASVADEVESYELAAKLTMTAHEIAADLVIGMAEVAGEWAGEGLTRFEREALRCPDSLKDVLADRDDRVEAYAAENGEEAPGEHSTINVAQLGLTSAVARV